MSVKRLVLPTLFFVHISSICTLCPNVIRINHFFGKYQIFIFLKLRYHYIFIIKIMNMLNVFLDGEKIRTLREWTRSVLTFIID